MKKIYFIRHEKTQGNIERKYIGITDQSLSQEGILALSQKIGSYPDVELVYTSPMKRCIETANIIYKDKMIIPISDLRECDFGIFENQNYEQLKENLQYRAWLSSGGTGDIPRGEKSSAFKTRCQNAFLDIVLHMYQESLYTVAIIAHGGTLMAILEKFSPVEHDFYHWQIKNGEMIAMTLKNKKIDKITR